MTHFSHTHTSNLVRVKNRFILFFMIAVLSTFLLSSPHASFAQTEDTPPLNSSIDAHRDQFAGYPQSSLSPKTNRSLLFLGTTAAVAGLFLAFGGASVFQSSTVKTKVRTRYQEAAFGVKED